jgi:hypothetical protein
MPLNVVLVAQRQSSSGMALTWSSLEGVSAYQIFVAHKKMTPEELEAAALLNGTDDCFVAKVGAEVGSVVDDITPQGEARHYGVAMIFDDGSVKAARFRAVPDGGVADSFHLSAVKMRMATGSYRIKPPPEAAGSSASKPIAPPPARAAAPAPRPAPAALAEAAEDPLEARKRAQREARARAAGETPTSPEMRAARAAPEPAARSAPEPAARSAPEPARAAAPAAVEEDPIEARKRMQRAARERAAAAAPAPAARSSSEGAPSPSASGEAPPPPSAVPLADPVDIRMQGATQTWDGLRIYWEREPRAGAYEVIASDHQIFGDELADALAGKADFTTATAVGPSTLCVIDNVTPREARGWYAVLVRYRDGRRAPHPFQVGDVATSGKTAGPFLNPNRTGELRAEVEGLLADAREQWERWKKEQDGGARREAKRMVGDALLIWPDYPAAKKLLAEMA